MQVWYIMQVIWILVQNILCQLNRILFPLSFLARLMNQLYFEWMFTCVCRQTFYFRYACSHQWYNLAIRDRSVIEANISDFSDFFFAHGGIFMVVTVDNSVFKEFILFFYVRRSRYYIHQQSIVVPLFFIIIIIHSISVLYVGNI